ncbi:leucine-rich repeat-containing protein 23 [Opisthocomus hoazin]|uniref:leucine-rich repeat-containing protein 23 n=1 Tax=Opisthocomus hoazin TaxID=30419 RepID=UPI003F53BB54
MAAAPGPASPPVVSMAAAPGPASPPAVSMAAGRRRAWRSGRGGVGSAACKDGGRGAVRPSGRGGGGGGGGGGGRSPGERGGLRTLRARPGQPALCSLRLPQAPAPRPLTEELLREGLTLLCKTGNGLAHAYVKFEARHKDLTDISLLEGFIHLRYVDLSENKLKDLSPLSSLTHLLWLKVDGNLLTSACMQELPYLQIISFAHNRIKDMEGITHPSLANLSLKGNKIQTALGLSHGQLFSLQILELRGNELESTAGLNLPKLKNLYLAQNAIRSLEDLEGLGHLTTLHLRDNQLETLDGFCSSMKCLQYLNLRNNGISSLREVAKLQVLPMLRALVLLDNPCSDEPDYRLEVLVLLPHLQRLDKELFEQDERAEAKKIRQKREKEEEGTAGSLEGDVAQ